LLNAAEANRNRKRRRSGVDFGINLDRRGIAKDQSCCLMLQQGNDESFVFAIKINDLVKFPSRVWTTDESNLLFDLVNVWRLVPNLLREVAHQQLEVFQLSLR